VIRIKTLRAARQGRPFFSIAVRKDKERAGDFRRVLF